MYRIKKVVSFFQMRCILMLYAVIFFNAATAQVAIIDMETPVVKETTSQNRQKLYKTLVTGINRNLSLPLADSTEENWMDAFYSIELLRYRSAWTESKLYTAFKGIENRSGYFQHALMECIYDAYPDAFEKEVRWLFDTTVDVKCFALCAEYLVRKKPGDPQVLKLTATRRNLYPGNSILNALWYRLLYSDQTRPPLGELIQYPFFPKAKVVFSFQRKNRNYPGIAVVRDSAGNFVKDGYGNIFYVPQLARSMSNLPGYISNGNTPQGIFRMFGFDKSKSTFIGPTPNIQLTMPGETGLNHFINDSTNTDSVWTMEWYRDILPKGWKTYMPFYETFFAGMAGRTEIIAHGTTVDPAYYKNTTYFPLTPTLGCLCTKEIWDETNGKRLQSDQQKLTDALKKAGGADGYYVVVELDDKQQPVDINEILPYIK
jgi:hypothetical protein